MIGQMRLTQQAMLCLRMSSMSAHPHGLALRGVLGDLRRPRAADSVRAQAPKTSTCSWSP